MELEDLRPLGKGGEISAGEITAAAVGRSETGSEGEQPWQRQQMDPLHMSLSFRELVLSPPAPCPQSSGPESPGTSSPGGPASSLGRRPGGEIDRGDLVVPRRHVGRGFSSWARAKKPQLGPTHSKEPGDVLIQTSPLGHTGGKIAHSSISVWHPVPLPPASHTQLGPPLSRSMHSPCAHGSSEQAAFTSSQFVPVHPGAQVQV